MIPERGVSYYGVAYPDRAFGDFDEMLEHGCNAVLLAVSEFDWWFWRRNVADLVSAARDRGLRAYVDLWGWGKTLAGEPPSLFLMRDVKHRQRAASGSYYNAICFNHLGFREFLVQSMEKIATEAEVDGFFWDEPHYANSRAHDIWPDIFNWIAPARNGCRHFDLLVGTDKIREGISNGVPVKELVEGWRDELASFLDLRREHLLYREGGI